MPDDSAPSGPSDLPSSERAEGARPLAASNGLHPEAAPEPSPVRAPRKVYEPTLLPTRRPRRRASPWLVVPAILAVAGAGFYGLYKAGHQRRFVPTSGKIVFASDQGSPGVTHLWIANADGTGATRLTSGGAADTAPAFAPDGSQIAFVSAREGGVNQIYRVDADGQGLNQVTRTTGSKAQPAYAPSDPSLLGFTAGGALATAELTTGETDRLLPPASEKTEEADADASSSVSHPATIPEFAWMPAKERSQQGLAAVMERSYQLPDHSEILLQRLALIPSPAGTPRLTTDGKPDGPPLAAATTMSLAWSPDGGLLAVAMLGIVGLPGGQKGSAIMLFDAQGNGLQHPPLAPVPSDQAGGQNPVFSPDGSKIVFEMWSQPDLARRRKLGLAVVSVDGGSPAKPIYAGDAEHVVFLPDGEHILFLKPRASGGHDLYEIALDGTGLKRLSDGTADISGVTVSPQASKS